MCQPDQDHDDQLSHVHSQGRSWRILLANHRDSGLPWYRVLTVSAANHWRKLRAGRDCCGNLGQPGC